MRRRGWMLCGNCGELIAVVWDHLNPCTGYKCKRPETPLPKEKKE